MSLVIMGSSEVVAQTLDTIIEQRKDSENNPQIKVGIDPGNMAINEITNKIYVANYVSGTVSVIDSDSGTVKNIGVGPAPNYIAVDSDHNRIYVANGESNTISVIDGNSDIVIGQISLRYSPDYIAVGEKGKIYVPNKGNSSVSVIDVSHNKKHDLPVGNDPTSIAFDSFYRKIYVANSGSNFVSVIYAPNDTKGNNIEVGGSDNLAVDFVHDKIYAVNGISNFVSVINATISKNEHHNIPLGYYPKYLAVDPSHNKTYVVGTDLVNNNTVSVIDSNTDNIPEQISIGNATIFPTDIALGEGAKIYIANEGSNSVSVINTTYKSGEIYKTETPDIPVGKNPSNVAVNHHTHMIYVANEKSDTISVIDGFSDKVTAGVTLNAHPANSGKIMCKTDGKDNEYPTGTYLFVDIGTICTAQQNNDFEFTGWVENLDRNSTIPLNDVSADLNINRFGTFTANFKPLPPTIPPAFWLLLVGIILSSLIGWSIPNVIGTVKTRTQRKHLKECMNLIGKLDKDEINKKITRYYVDGKISESHLELLKNEIIMHYERVKDSQGSPF